MAKAKKAAVSGDIEWYLISIDRLKQIGLVILLILLSIWMWWFWSNHQHNPRTMAETAIGDARRALNELAAAKDFNQHRNEFDSAQRKLDGANALLAQAKFPEAQSAALESQTISRAALSGGVLDTDAQFVTVQGDVSYQRSSTSDWKRAEERGGLFNGDWVKTSDSASAQLMFSNGSLYTVGPNALLEIYSTFKPGTTKKENSVQVQSGPIEVATTDDASTVRTPGTQVIVDSSSQTLIGVDPQQKTTSVMTTKGTASVAPAAGGETVKLASGEKINATQQGTISAVKKLLPPPVVNGPADNQVFQLAPESRVSFAWEPQPGASGYLLQVSRSQIFTTQEVNSRRTKPGATAKLTDEGVFYWRVASLSPDGEIGPFSPTRRFRASGSGPASSPGAANQNAPPPNLKLKQPFRVSNEFYIIEGVTDPGSTVFIAEEEVEVESNGHFKKLVTFNKIGRNIVVIKAVNAAGKPTIKNQEVLVESE
jgi:hypothetical protein